MAAPNDSKTTISDANCLINRSLNSVESDLQILNISSMLLFRMAMLCVERFMMKGQNIRGIKIYINTKIK